MKDWERLENLRIYYPGMDPMANSFRRNMLLWDQAQARNKPKDPAKEAAEEFLAELEEQLRMEQIRGEYD